MQGNAKSAAAFPFCLFVPERRAGTVIFMKNKKTVAVIVAVALAIGVIALVGAAYFVTHRESEPNVEPRERLAAEVVITARDNAFYLDRDSAIPLDFEGATAVVFLPEDLPQNVSVVYRKDTGSLTFEYEQGQYTVAATSAKDGEALSKEIRQSDAVDDPEETVLRSGAALNSEIGISVAVRLPRDKEVESAQGILTSILASAAPCSGIETVTVQKIEVDTSFFDAVLLDSGIVTMEDDSGKELKFALYDGKIEDLGLEETLELEGGSRILSDKDAGNTTTDKLYAIDTGSGVLNILVNNESDLKAALGAKAVVQPTPEASATPAP